MVKTENKPGKLARKACVLTMNMLKPHLSLIAHLSHSNIPSKLRCKPLSNSFIQNCQFKSCTDSYSVTLTGKSQAKVRMMRGPSPSDGGWEMPTNRRSWIWNHYLINEQQYPDDARCCHCDRRLKFKSNSESRGRTIYTSTLIKHLYSVHQIDQNGKFAVQSVANSWS